MSDTYYGFLDPGAQITNAYGAQPEGIDYALGKHTGLDIAYNDNIARVLAPGIVADVGYNNTYGNYIWIQNQDGNSTLYGHLKMPTVKKGDIVQLGDMVGIQGQTGKATGPHVHVEVRQNRKDAKSTIDPLQYYKDLQGGNYTFSPTTEEGGASALEGVNNIVSDIISNGLSNFKDWGLTSLIRIIIILFAVFLIYKSIKAGFLGGA